MKKSKPKRTTRQAVFRKLENLYGKMQSAYDELAGQLGHTCKGCTKNCCVSFFQHHTYLEWSYLWKGLNELPKERRETYVARANQYIDDAHRITAQGLRPVLMCPLNDDGLCGMYEHRLMICRLHGLPNFMSLPNGQQKAFPGCWRSQELTQQLEEKGMQVQPMDRTPLYLELANLEVQFLGNKKRTLPKVDLTLAEMIAAGPPKLAR